MVDAKVDLRSQFGPVRDQGARPTCLAFAASDAHAALRAGWEPLSCEYAFYHAQQRAARPPTKGALLRSMLQSLSLDGQPPEDKWPYLPATPTPDSWNPPADAAPLYARNGAPGKHGVCEIVSLLDSGLPVIILMNLSASFFNPKEGGLIDDKPGETPEPAQRHAVVAVGYGSADKNQVILVRNSWGSSWGASGYGWLTEQYLERRLFASALLAEEMSVSGSPTAA